MSEIACQARICPICIDDHSEDAECKVVDLKQQIERLNDQVTVLTRQRDHYWNIVNRQRE